MPFSFKQTFTTLSAAGAVVSNLIPPTVKDLLTSLYASPPGHIVENDMPGPTAEDLAELPTPDTITLLFKCHKSTAFLSVLPTKPFTEIKALLLAVLQSRNLETLPNSTTPLPKDPQDFEFGVLADKKDVSKGWVSLEIKEQEVSGPKGARKKVGGKASVLNETPLGAGLSDGAWIAFRVRPAQQEIENEDADMQAGTPDVEIDEDPGWDVVLPRFDDENE